MRFPTQTTRGFLPLAGGLALGLSLSLWVGVQAGALLPGFALTSVSAGAVVSGIVPLSARADAVGFANVQFQVSGQPVGSMVTSGPCTVSWDTRGYSNGIHTVTAVARDSLGSAVWAAPALVTVANGAPDSTPPSVSVSSPSAGATLAGVVTFVAAASDNVGVRGVWFTIDGGTIGPELTPNQGQAQLVWSTTAVANGVRVLRALARDAAGNVATSAARTVTVNNIVDTTLPSVVLTAPAGGGSLLGNVMLSAIASDNVGVVGVQFKVNGANIGPEDTVAPYQAVWATTSHGNGSQSLTAVARDAYGNTRTSAAVIVTVGNAGSGVAGDFNYDGYPDLLFRHTDGRLYVWLMTDATSVGQRALTPGAMDAAWRVAGVDDFNSDDKSDILLQNLATGQVSLWYMDGTARVGETTVASSTPWRVSATADIDGDGDADIIWRHPATGQVYVWTIQGGQVVGGSPLTPGAVDLSWRLAAASDINRDGRADLVWQNTATGGLYIWCMTGATMAFGSGTTPAGTSLVWRLKAVADYNRDGYADFAWQHVTTGQLYIWRMAGAGLVGEGLMTPAQVDVAWQIVTGW